MNILKFLYFGKILFNLLLLRSVSINAECNVCQPNQAACINTTSYYLCFGEPVPNTNVLYHCKDGFDCTNLNAICVQSSSSRKPSCGDTSQCGLCSAHRNYLFTCTSRTTFQMCYGATHPSGQIGFCPPGYVCEASNDAICVNELNATKVTCDIQETPSSSTSSTSSTPAITDTTTTPSTIPKTPNEICAEMREVGLFPTQPKDPLCLRYIYCYYNNGVIKGMQYSCASGSFYNVEREQCTFQKPVYCI